MPIYSVNNLTSNQVNQPNVQLSISFSFGKIRENVSFHNYDSINRRCCLILHANTNTHANQDSWPNHKLKEKNERN